MNKWGAVAVLALIAVLPIAGLTRYLVRSSSRRRTLIRSLTPGNRV